MSDTNTLPYSGHIEIVIGPMFSSKCLAKGTKLFMYNGSVKEVQDLKPGEQLMGDDGTPRTISIVGTGHGPMYRIEPFPESPASSFECNDEHILVLKLSGRPYIQELNRKKAVSNFTVHWVEHETTTNIVRRRCKCFSYGPIARYASKEVAKQEAEKFMANLPNLAGDGFIWETSVKNFLKSQKGVQQICKMFKPASLTFQDKEGYFASVLERTLGTKPSTEQVKISAWAVGAWLGDGTSKQPSFTVGQFEESIMSETLKKAAEMLGCGYSIRLSENGREYPIFVVRIKRHPETGKNAFQRLLENLGIFKNKHIPEQMITDNLENVRLPLLAGLFDTDGCLSKTHHDGTTGSMRYYFTQVRKDIVESVRRIANISGFTCNQVYHQPVIVNGEQRSYWQTSIYGNEIHKIPCVITRKQALTDNGFGAKGHRKKNSLAWGFKIQSIGNGDYYGFTVDGNQRMLLEDMTVTHNTTFIHHRINKYLIAGKECLVIKYAQDTRYSGANELSTHDGKKIAAVSAERIADIPLHMFEKADVIAIDEGQFFPDIYEMADRFANQGKIVLVSALDGDFKRVPFDAAQGFGDIAKLISRAEKVKKLSAICVQCKCDNAAFTAKIAGNKDATKEIGGADLYVPLCRKCYFTTPHANSENL